MNNRHAVIFASLMFVLSVSNPARADEAVTVSSAPTEMTQEEYAAYRARIREQMEAAQQVEQKHEADATTRRKPNSGYGQGYRVRQERSGGGARAGMGRAGGHGR